MTNPLLIPHFVPMRRYQRASMAVALVLALFAFAVSAPAGPQHLVAPGGIAVFPVADLDQPRPTVTYKGKRVAVKRGERDWEAVLGLSLGTEPGDQFMTIAIEKKAVYRLGFTVQERAYPEEHLTVKNPRHVNPNEEDMARIRSERERRVVAFSRFRAPDAAPNLDFDWPLRGRQTSPFGIRRFFNGEPRNPHSGLDIAGATGTPVATAANGVVTEAGDFFYSGNTVFVDHGQGVITMYGHLSKIHVAVGESVSKGQRIGDVGATGRVTGPHLHFSVALNDMLVDPLLMLPQVGDSAP